MAQDGKPQGGERDVMPGWPEAGFEARGLLRGGRSASLATLSEGQPFVSLATHAVDADGSLLMLLSGLSEHTRHLAASAGCSVMVLGEARGPNPQTTPRVTITGRAARDEDPARRSRWIARHPYAAFYAGFADFALWRIVPEAGLIVAGFGRAARLDAASLRPDAAVGAALAPLLAELAERWAARGDGSRLVSMDADGVDAEGPNGLVRHDFPHPAESVAAAMTLLSSLSGGSVSG